MNETWQEEVWVCEVIYCALAANYTRRLCVIYFLIAKYIQRYGGVYYFGWVLSQYNCITTVDIIFYNF